MAAVGGLLGYVGLFVLLAASMTLAAEGVSRLVGARGFRWFSAERSTDAWWRVLLVRLAAAAAPWLLSVALFAVHFALQGVTVSRGGTYVEVLPGPAQQAGMQDGDRVLRVGEHEVHGWDEMRAIVQQQTGPVDFEVERGSSRRILRVTPRNGKISVALQTVSEPLNVGGIAKHSLASPGQVVWQSARAFLRSATSVANQAELQGPVGVAREIGKSGTSGFVWMLASLCAYAWPTLLGVVLFDLATGAVFHATHPGAVSTPQRGYRLARLHQALLLSMSAYLVAIPVEVLHLLNVPSVVLLVVWVMPTFASAYPLVWLSGREVWPRPFVVLAFLGALFVPCITLGASLVLLRRLQQSIKNEGFRFGWLRSEPPSPSSAEAA